MTFHVDFKRYKDAVSHRETRNSSCREVDEPRRHRFNSDKSKRIQRVNCLAHLLISFLFCLHMPCSGLDAYHFSHLLNSNGTFQSKDLCLKSGGVQWLRLAGRAKRWDGLPPHRVSLHLAFSFPANSADSVLNPLIQRPTCIWLGRSVHLVTLLYTVKYIVLWHIISHLFSFWTVFSYVSIFSDERAQWWYVMLSNTFWKPSFSP